MRDRLLRWSLAWAFAVTGLRMAVEGKREMDESVQREAIMDI